MTTSDQALKGKRRSAAWDRFELHNRLLTDLVSVMSLLSWDQETMMPPKAGAMRARQYARLASLHHEKLTDPVYGELLDSLQEEELDEWDRVGVREARRDYDRATKVPPELVKELARTISLAYHKWLEARQQDDFEMFRPWLEKVIDLKRQEARCLKLGSCLYDSLLDEFEPGMTVSQLDPLFKTLRPRLSQLVERIQKAPRQPNPSLLKGDFSPEKQRAFGRRIVTAMGYDWESGRLDKSPHPFCSGLTPTDVRITTRYSNEDLSVALFGMIHEAGHALYEQGIDHDRFGHPAARTVSLGIHESQSRLWEIFLGRSRPFWEFWYPKLQKKFPGHFQKTKLEGFLRAINQVRPSLIRVDADEVTYGLHVILRYEIEKKLLDGDLPVAELPRVWNQKMQEYLGLEPPSAADGVLQDVHWAHGLVGYFPTYLLGTLYANQFFNQACRAIPNLTDQISQGRYHDLLGWLRTHIHRVGRTRGALELVQEICGEPLNPLAFLDYLEKKYSRLYGM